eukprot:2968318-Rhodomonas_salina.1
MTSFLMLTLDWKCEKQAVRDKINKAVELLKGSAYTYDQLDTVVRACIVQLFRYSAAVTQWTTAELATISQTFAQALRLKTAWKLP